MFDLNSNLLLSFVIGIVFFIVKVLITRIYKVDKDRKEIVKDTLLLFILTYIVLSFKRIFIPSKEKIEVFTNEPNF